MQKAGIIVVSLLAVFAAYVIGGHKGLERASDIEYLTTHYIAPRCLSYCHSPKNADCMNNCICFFACTVDVYKRGILEHPKEAFDFLKYDQHACQTECLRMNEADLF